MTKDEITSLIENKYRKDIEKLKKAICDKARHCIYSGEASFYLSYLKRNDNNIVQRMAMQEIESLKFVKESSDWRIIIIE